MGIPRLARLLLLSTLVITVPTLYFLYPHRETILQTTQGYLEKGGIDSSHWRDPLPPPGGIRDELDQLEHEEVRDWEGQDVFDESAADQGVPPVINDKQDGAPTPNTNGQSLGVAGVAEGVSSHILDGGVIMPKLENATAKAELGRAAWKVLHLMTLRYPDIPSTSDREALKSYFHLFARLYPCGECATEFQALLKEYPPQTSSRKTASLWLCHIHNLINARLGKPEFDCLTLDATYDCGCGPDGNATSASTSLSPDPASETARTAGLSHEHQDWERRIA